MFGGFGVVGVVGGLTYTHLNQPNITGSLKFVTRDKKTWRISKEMVKIDVYLIHTCLVGCYLPV